MTAATITNLARPGDYLVGVTGAGWHAIDTVLHHDDRPDSGIAACHGFVPIATKYGCYTDRIWPRHNPCPECAWKVAARTDTLNAELDRLHPAAAAVARGILAAAERDGGDPDGNRVVQLLAATVEHGPRPAVNLDCSEGEHDHDGDCPVVGWVCEACTLRAGGWAGEWEGQYLDECTIAAPCEVLRTLAAHFGVALAAVCDLPDTPETKA